MSFWQSSNVRLRRSGRGIQPARLNAVPGTSARGSAHHGWGARLKRHIDATIGVFLGTSAAHSSRSVLVVELRLAAMIFFIMADKKIVDERFDLAKRRGGGSLRREVWVDAKQKVTRYNLAYIRAITGGS